MQEKAGEGEVSSTKACVISVGFWDGFVVQVMAKLSQWSFKPHAVKTYGEVEVEPRTFLTSVRDVDVCERTA
jgi:hypothetical protein